MKTVAILGSGFGLYGYLPAMLEAGAGRIVLPRRYQDRFAGRKELTHLAEHIEWASDETAALEKADCAVMALRPDLQEQRLRECIAYKNITRLLLEKPLARTPDIAQSLFDSLLQSQKNFRIGYVFRFTPWGERLLASLQGVAAGAKDKVKIDWHFLAHHYRHDLPNWKRSHKEGGGALRFYGIHLIALLAEVGYDTVASSFMSGAREDDVASWEASFAGAGLPECRVAVDSCAKAPLFRIVRNTGGAAVVIAQQCDPFDDVPATNGLDKRVALLARLCASFVDNAQETYAWYRRSLLLWAEVERRTAWEAHHD